MLRACKCPWCGPKLAACCGAISVWGFVMMMLLGGFFYVNSTTLIEDLWKGPALLEITLADKPGQLDIPKIHQAMHNSAYNCWIAAVLYLATLIFTISQFYISKRIQQQSAYDYDGLTRTLQEMSVEH